MNILSISYKKAEYDIRADIADRYNKTPDVYGLLKREVPWIDGIVILSTCNRFELIYSVGNSEDSTLNPKRVADKFFEIIECKIESLTDILKIYSGEMAIRHLIRVATGVDSMVLGEDDILRQIKESYSFSLEGGYSNKELNVIFQRTFEAAKELKTKTGISKVPVSIGTLVTNKVLSIPKEKLNILIIGASGKIGGIVLRDLIAKVGDSEDKKIYGTVRKHSSGENMFWDIYPEAMIKVDYHDRYKVMDDIDVVISATTSPHFTLTYSRLKEVITTEKPRLYIDLAVPEDIDSDILYIPESSIMRIDDFKELSAKYNEKKKSLADSLEQEIGGWTEDIGKELALCRILGRSKEIADKLSEVGVTKLLMSARDYLSSNEMNSVAQWMERIIGE